MNAYSTMNLIFHFFLLYLLPHLVETFIKVKQLKLRLKIRNQTQNKGQCDFPVSLVVRSNVL